MVGRAAPGRGVHAAAQQRRARPLIQYGVLRMKLRLIAVAVGVAFALPARAETTIASYYWEDARTATGERFYPDGLTAAHRNLPFGTRLRVKSIATGRSVVVRINDRGPFIVGRDLDLSRGAARVIGMIAAGVTRVTYTILGR